MGLIYWNIINTLIGGERFNNTFVFTVNNFGEDCKMYYCKLNDFIELFNIKHYITFKQPKTKFLTRFAIDVDGSEREIDICDFNQNGRKFIISYQDNRDTPLDNTTQMYHSPFLIMNQTIIKLPKNDILKFEIQNSKLKPTFKLDELKLLKHGNYNVCTVFHPEIRTLIIYDCTLSFKSDYECFLTKGITKKQEYEFSLKYCQN